MKLTKQEKKVRKYFAVFAIYLVFSLTFIGANSLALSISYSATGDANISGVRAKTDTTRFNTVSQGNVSLLRNDGDDVPFDCDITNPKHCSYALPQDTVDDGVNSIPFVLLQDAGTPSQKNGNITVDSVGPTINYFNASKKPTGIAINYSITDYLYPGSFSQCTGLDRIIFHVGNDQYVKVLNTISCTSFGSYFINMSGNQSVNVYIEAIDKVLNPPTISDSQQVGGDFELPKILDEFEVISGGKNLTTVSTAIDTLADFAINVEDGNLDINNVYGDFTKVNSNTGISYLYSHVKSVCTKYTDSDREYRCIFSGIKVKPKNETITFAITAQDLDQNIVSKIFSYDLTIITTAGSLLYIGPDKSQCTKDLSKCFIHKLGNIFYMEFDDSSSYKKSAVTFGFDGTKMPGFCFLDDSWSCRSYYNVPIDSTQVKIFVASPSTDDYGNNVPYKERIAIVDSDPPQNITPLLSDAANCSLPGENLKLYVNVSESLSPELKIYVNSSSFSSKDVQTGACNSDGSGIWECELILTSLASQYLIVNENVVIEDLAGNKLLLPHTFEICEPNTNTVPNYISKVEQTRIPNIDRRTASITDVKTYIPLRITKRSDATIIGIDITSCSGADINGLDMLGTEQSYFLTQGNNPILALYVGHSGVQLPETQALINCTINFRIRTGPTVFNQPEQEKFVIKLNTYNNPLGTLDSSTGTEIIQVKQHLKDLDSEIKTRQTFENTLGLLCKIAEVLGTMNSLMQAVKSVIYGILIVVDALLGWTGIGFAGVQSAWMAVQSSLGGFHNFINTNIWPTGIIPTSLGPGAFVKWGCMLYTCKHLDFGTYLNIGLDAATTGYMTGNGAGATSVTIETSKITSGNAKNINFQYTGIRTTNYNNLGDIPTSDSPDIKANMLSNNKNVLDGIGSHQWLLNPYRSVHFDDTCAPAILYNTKKEKQIDCKYLTCLEKQAQSGLPKTVCDLDKKYNTCLYLDSAEYLAGSNWKSFFKGLSEAVFNNILGIAFSAIYLVGCWNYYVPGGFANDEDFHSMGFHSAVCGVSGAYFGLTEIFSVAKNGLPNFGDQNPVPSGKDYCSGVQY